MTAAPEIPADVMAAARDVVVAYIEDAVGPVSAPFRGQVDRGEFDDWPLYAASARAILAERRRCAALLKDPQCDVVPYLMSDAAVDAFFALPSEQPT